MTWQIYFAQLGGLLIAKQTARAFLRSNLRWSETKDATGPQRKTFPIATTATQFFVFLTRQLEIFSLANSFSNRELFLSASRRVESFRAAHPQKTSREKSFRDSRLLPSAPSLRFSTNCSSIVCLITQSSQIIRIVVE